MTSRPDRGEAAEYYFTYINQVPDGDIRHLLHQQLSQTLALLEGVGEEDAWARRGVASDNPVTVRALAYITAGHVAHHMTVLRTRYLKD